MWVDSIEIGKFPVLVVDSGTVIAVSAILLQMNPCKHNAPRQRSQLYILTYVNNFLLTRFM